METEAIKKISDLTLASANQANDNTDHKVVMVPKDMRIDSLEEHQDKRYRFRGRFDTEILQSFIDYVGELNGNKVFINHGVMRAQTIFDMDDLGHCAHTANLSLVKTPEYQSVCDMNALKMSQRDVAEFVEDWKDNITAQDAEGAEMSMKECVSAIRLISIEAMQKADMSVGQMSESKSTLETIEATNGDKPLPAWIFFKCAPYDGFDERTFAMRLSISTDTLARSDPQLMLRVQGLDKAVFEMADELAEKLTNGLSDAKVYNGTMDVS